MREGDPDADGLEADTDTVGVSDIAEQTDKHSGNKQREKPTN